MRYATTHEGGHKRPLRSGRFRNKSAFLFFLYENEDLLGRHMSHVASQFVTCARAHTLRIRHVTCHTPL